MMKKILLKMMNPFFDQYTLDFFTKEYSSNPFVMLTAAEKMGLKNIVEAQMRAETGKVLSLPYGSNIKFSPWDKLLLNPRQLFNLPTKYVSQINTETIIGKNCKKPLKLSMPIMVTGMSYGGSLSFNMKVAVAKGTKMAGTSTNTGESTIIKEVKENCKYVVGQYNRACLMKEEDLPLLDAIEVQLGQGAWGGAVESTTYAYEIDEKLRKDWRMNENEDKMFKARMKGIESQEDLKKLIEKLKNKYDVPIGIKIAATDFIEKELDVITSTKCDFIVIDGVEGGTAVAPPTLEDNLGLPTLYALIRTVKYLEQKNIKDKFDLIITGGLTSPGHFLKALALGADAVYIGSIAVFAAVHNQAVKTLPEEPPTQLALNTGKNKGDLDIDLAAKSLCNFLMSCNEEMKLALQATGKKKYSELSKSDVVSLDKEISDYTGINYVLRS